MDRKIYDQIKQNKEQTGLKLVTAIDGEHCGEKLLCSNHEILYASDQSQLLQSHLKEITEQKLSKKMEFEGQTSFCECIGSVKKLVICGGGHVSKAIVTIAKSLGFMITVIEDRPQFANMAREQQVAEVICDNFVHALKSIVSDEDTYFVIVTRGHRFDKECFMEILSKKYAYVGMMGSKRRIIMLKKDLIEEGYKEDRVNELHAPIGIEIQAETPEEIAVSIMGEIILEKHKHQKTTGYSSELMDALTNPEQNMVLATIIVRRGSAPREIGTKMVILPDGRTIGTIGGGCMENEVIREAISMFQKDITRSRVKKVDMSGQSAEEEGMVCGGTIEVLLEVL